MAGNRKRKQRAKASAGSGSSPNSSNNSSVNSAKETPKKQKITTSTPLSAPTKETLSKFAFQPNENEEIMEDKGSHSDVAQANESNAVFSPASDLQQTKPSYTNADLMDKLCANGAKISKLSDMVEELKTALFSVQEENEKLRQELTEVRKRELQTATQLAEAKHLAELADRRAEEVSAYVRRSNLRIYGVQEGENGAEETGDQCEEKVLSLFNRKLNIAVKREDLEAVHRVGPKARQGPKNSGRGIIVCFVSRRVRDSVLYSRKRLKGTRVTMVEDLTPRAYQLLCAVKNNQDICQQAWTKNGAVVVKTVAGKIAAVKSLSELQQLR